MKTKFTAGDTAWSKQGERIHVVDVTTSGRYVVAPMVEYGGSYDEPPTVDLGAFQIVDEIFAESPRHIVDEQMAKAKEAVKQAVDELAGIQRQIRDATAERTRLLDKLKQVPALAYIEQFLDGKMGWIVITDYGCGYKVMPMVDALKLEDSWRDKELKLLSLFGGAKGDLHWRLSTYHDGSGSKIELWPFETQEAAKAFALQRLLHDVEEAFAQYLGDARYAGHLATRAKWLAEAGGTVTASAQEVIDRAKRQSLERERDDAAKYAAQYNDKVAGIDAALAKLP